MSEPAVPLDPAAERNLRRLKLVVIILGVMLVLGLFGLVGGIIWKASKPKATGDSAGEAAAPISAIAAGAVARLALPAGASVVDMELDGNRILLRVKSAEGEELIVYDVAKNAVIARVELAPAP